MQQECDAKDPQYFSLRRHRSATGNERHQEINRSCFETIDETSRLFKLISNFIQKYGIQQLNIILEKLLNK